MLFEREENNALGPFDFSRIGRRPYFNVLLELGKFRCFNLTHVSQIVSARIQSVWVESVNCLPVFLAMNQLPRISIIIPTKNSREILLRLLASIERQTFREFEVIVIDNFSTDGTFEILKTKKVEVFQVGPERHKQRTFGAEKARGEYLMFFDSDMELDPDLLSECIQLAQKGFDAVIIPERGGGEGYWANCQKLEKECYWNDRWMEAANRFIKKSIYERVGGYRPDLIAGEDFELHDRLLAAGAKIGRATSMITHYEDARFWRVVRKKFYYGSKMTGVVKEKPLNNAKRFVLIKPAYVKNWKRLLRHPLLTAGLITMKGTQFAAGATGFFWGCLTNKRQPA